MNILTNLKYFRGQRSIVKAGSHAPALAYLGGTRNVEITSENLGRNFVTKSKSSLFNKFSDSKSLKEKLNINFQDGVNPNLFGRAQKKLDLTYKGPMNYHEEKRQEVMEILNEEMQAGLQMNKNLPDNELTVDGKAQDDFYPKLMEDTETVEPEGIYLKTSENLFPEEEYINNVDKKVKEEEAKFGDYSESLVRRPKKGFMWGLGTESFTRDTNSEYFTYGKLPTIKQVIRFLEIFQVKDVKALDLQRTDISHLSKYAILGSCFSPKHLYHTGKTL